MITDIVVGLSYGDEGKGKVTQHLLKSGEYTHCIRFNGGCNAGHTIYHNGKKFVTHHIPAGVFFGVRSIIGSGCVVNLQQFYKEIKMLEDGGINTEDLIFIAKNAHIITNEHLNEDGKDTKIGTTKQGNGPAYRDKYDRNGITAGDHPDLINSDYLVDLYDELHGRDAPTVLCEGAQGFGLDIDWGDYPFVTSSHCTSAGALLNGIPPQSIRRIYGVAKAYDTYVGSKRFHGHENIFNDIQGIGKEFGATTGRRRQCNWLDIKNLQRAVDINGVTDLIINKVDILREVDVWGIRREAATLKFDTEQRWKSYIENNFDLENMNLIFSESPERI